MAKLTVMLAFIELGDLEPTVLSSSQSGELGEPTALTESDGIVCASRRLVPVATSLSSSWSVSGNSLARQRF